MINTGKQYLAIFDLDGTLFDTTKVNYFAYSKALEKEKIISIGFDFDYFCKFCNGNDFRDFIPKVCGSITQEQLELVHKRKTELYRENLGMARKNELLFQMAKSLKKDYYIAIATTASKKNTNDILEYFNEKELFDIIVTKEDVLLTKPEAECYKTIMSKLKIAPENTMIFEDSEIGIEAARKSGASYIRVYGFN